VEIPLDDTAPSDITDQVALYFQLGGAQDEPVAEKESIEPIVITASFPQ
jgi:hypothetical protein